MKDVLVLGASGGIGSALVQELVGRGIHVRAFARDEAKMKDIHAERDGKVRYIPGNALVLNDILHAAHSVDTIFHAISFPYEDWQENHMLCLKNVLEAASTNQANLVFADNIYAYGPSPGYKLKESNSKNPQTNKGKLRLAMEQEIEKSPVPSIIAHLPDVFGPRAENTILNITFEDVANNKSARFIGPLDQPREFLYTKDAAKALAELALHDHAYNQYWNIPPLKPVTGNQLIHIIKSVTDYQKSARTMSKSMLNMIGLFQPTVREMKEMFYLTDQPVFIDGKKYEDHIGPLPHTPLETSLKETLDWYKTNQIKDKSIS
ncbi:NAD-dependent epimerase/dehydratase family protein [Salisediminibacterium halotolerans]|uniref:Nucleoside-diphosphate-sugar epimerase n=1 Tax=Salisediminibacterium halotolerans TaxID=517425 RepID=A0A1H9TNM4_9BACI|nr:NAD-dependent epimerase/dehydratase family protein [Salisediminibacterium haloalkalitolerans]SER98529.1 Nucleoside-diphosphate-sugar epimerase [Salisediminibacterium haloalkalitolerans]